MYEVDVRFLFDKDNKLSEFEAEKFISEVAKKVITDYKDEIVVAYVHNDIEHV